MYYNNFFESSLLKVAKMKKRCTKENYSNFKTGELK